MDNIRIEIHCSDYLVNAAAVFVFFVLCIWLALLINFFSVGSLVGFLIVFALSVGYAIVDDKIPTVVVADNKCLKVKHLLGWKTVELSKIMKMTCEPYTVHTRYSAYQRIRLTVITSDDDELDINDSVNTENILNDRLEAKETDIPVIRLYEFLKVRTAV